MNLRTYSPTLLINVANPDSLFQDNQRVKWIEAIDKIRQECKCDYLDAVITISQLTEQGHMSPIESSALVEFWCEKKKLEEKELFYQIQNKIQQYWFSPDICHKLLWIEQD